MNSQEIGPVLPDLQACIAWASERPLPDPSIPTAISMLPPTGGGYVRENAEGDLNAIQLLMGNILWWGLNEIRLARGMDGVREFTDRLMQVAMNLEQPFRGSDLAVFQPGEYELIQEFEGHRE